MTNELIVRDLLLDMRKRICSGKSLGLDCCVLGFLRQPNLTYYEKFKTKEEAKLNIIDYLAFCVNQHAKLSRVEWKTYVLKIRLSLCYCSLCAKGYNFIYFSQG